MGTAKLLLPWPTKTRPHGSVIDAVAAAWRESQVSESFLIVRPDDREIQEQFRCSQMTVVKPSEAPTDMTQSAQIGLRYLEERFSPRPIDGVFLSPSDVPQLTAQVIDSLIEASTVWDPEHASEDKPPKVPHVSQSFAAAKNKEDPSSLPVLSPLFGDHSGHPVLFAYATARRILDLPAGVGIDTLVRGLPRRRVSLPVEWLVEDCDTPAAYQHALTKLRDQS
ncbi:MAG TPA: hypothetical protein DDW52_18915 [Planctomycetaceae bacterium]|nr:hypothetical protein [Planctomycetaceae bacterium]